MYLYWNESIIYLKLPDNNLKIGIDDNDSWIIKDENGYWWNFIKYCDGEKEELEIIDYFSSLYETKKNVIKSAIKQFIKKGFIIELDSKLSENTFFQKNKINILFFHNKNTNGIKLIKHLNRKKVVIFGLGGGGFTYFQLLISIGVKNFILVDYDKIESSNIDRQISWNKNHIGKFKTDVAYEIATEKYNDLNIEIYNKKITAWNEVSTIIKDSDFVFSCMDEPPYKLQRIMNYACIKEKKPIIFSFCQKGSGRFFISNPSVSGCVDCLFDKVMNEHNYHFMTSLFNSKIKPSTATSSYSISMFCSIVISKWIKFIENKEKNNKKYINSIFKISFDKCKIKKTITWDKNHNCVSCGSGEVKKESFLDKFFQVIKII